MPKEAADFLAGGGSGGPPFVWWSRELLTFYNDAYIPVLEQRNPSALGRPAAEVWHEIWNISACQCRTCLTVARPRGTRNICFAQ